MKRALEDYEGKKSQQELVQKHPFNCMMDLYGRKDIVRILHSFYSMEELCRLSVVLGEHIWGPIQKLCSGNPRQFGILLHLANQRYFPNLRELSLSYVFGNMDICSSLFPALRRVHIEKSNLCSLDIQIPLDRLHIIGVTLLASQKFHVRSPVTNVRFQFVCVEDGFLRDCIVSMPQIQSLEILTDSPNNDDMAWNSHNELVCLDLQYQLSNRDVQKTIHVQNPLLRILHVDGIQCSSLPDLTQLRELTVSSCDLTTFGRFPFLRRLVCKEQHFPDWKRLCERIDQSFFPKMETLHLEMYQERGTTSVIDFSLFPVLKDVFVSQTYFTKASARIGPYRDRQLTVLCLTNSDTIQSLESKVVCHRLEVSSLSVLTHLKLLGLGDVHIKTEIQLTDLPKLQNVHTVSSDVRTLKTNRIGRCIWTHMHDSQMSKDETEAHRECNNQLSVDACVVFKTCTQLHNLYKQYTGGSKEYIPGAHYDRLTLLDSVLQARVQVLCDAFRMLGPYSFDWILNTIPDNHEKYIHWCLRHKLEQNLFYLHYVSWRLRELLCIQEMLHAYNGSLQTLQEWGILQVYNQPPAKEEVETRCLYACQCSYLNSVPICTPTYKGISMRL